MSSAAADEDPKPTAAGGGDAAAASAALMDLDIDAYSWPVDFGSLVAGSPLFFAGSPPPLGAGMGGLMLSGFDSASPLWMFEVEERGGEVGESPVECSGILNGIGDNTDEKSKVTGKSSQCQILAVDENSEESCLIKERMTQALRYFKDSTDQQVLLQVWAPIRNGNRIVLTTSGQPFVLDPQSTKLLHYRTVSLTYVFSADEDSDGNLALGLPGRVFKRKLPEWTPNVQYYSDAEYQRLSHALQYNVQGTLALPVFDPLGQSCICVVELVLMSQRINYSHEVDKVCKALEAVNLKSSEILDHPNVQISNEGRQAALAEILEILTVVCETQNLPIAQTWIPCKHRTVLTHGGGLKKNCSSFDGSCNGQVCMSTTDVAFYVVDAHMWGFRDACVEHHLQKGQGVAGMAFSSRRPCFCRNITKFCKSEYPLVHYAKMFGLSGCLAICLQSCHSGEDDYILEFFFPLDCTSPTQQQALLYSITSLIRQCLRTLKVSADVNFQEGSSFELVNLALDDNGKILRIPSQSGGEIHVHTSPETNCQELHYDSTNEEDHTTGGHLKNQVSKGDDSKSAEAHLHSKLVGNVARKGPEKRRGKAEKTVSLEVLQQYFSGSLKDAAKSLGVCPTTMKRICRQHGISRWPSRKINKVNRSLSKLKCAIESVQGADGALNLTNLASHLPVTVDSVALPVNSDRFNNSKVIVGGKDLAIYEGQGIKDRQSNSANLHEPILEKTATKPEPDKCSPSPKSSSEESMNSPTSHGSCQGSPVNETFPDNQLDSHELDQHLNTGCSLDFTKERAYDVNHLYENLMIGAGNFGAQPLGRTMVEDAGSSKDLKDLCTTRVISRYEHAMIPTRQMTVDDSGTVTIKANYKENIIRFRLPCNASVVTLHDEVAKRLKLEPGTFDTKYLDDDHEWVMLACDADLEECIEISRLSGAHVIRLSVSDIMPNLGRSCESSGD